MNQSETELILILDASGSMEGRRAETIHAVNKFIEEQKKQPGAAKLTIVTFNSIVTPYYSALPLEMAQPLATEAYKPNGYTALLDAVGQTIDRVGARLLGIGERERPGRVVVLVITDGHENVSRKFTKADILAKIEHQKAKYNWQFLFLGADVTTFDEAGALGFNYAQTMSWEPEQGGLLKGMIASNNAVSSFRGGVTGQAVYTNQDRTDNKSK